MQLSKNSTSITHEQIYTDELYRFARIISVCIRISICVYPFLYFPGGGEGDRTPDLLNANQVLSQLSYAPKFAKQIWS